MLVAVTAVWATGRSIEAEVDQFLEARVYSAQRIALPPFASGEVISIRAFNEVVEGRLRGDDRGQVGPNNQRRPPILPAFDSIVQINHADGELALILEDYPEIPFFEPSGGGVHYRTVDVDESSFRVAAVASDNNAVLQIGRSLDESNATLDRLRGIIFGLGTAFAVVAGLVGWLTAKRVVTPIENLSEAAATIAQTGDLSTSIESSGQDEVGRLGASFNVMLEALRTSRTQQRQLIEDASHELRTPLTSLRTKHRGSATPGRPRRRRSPGDPGRRRFRDPRALRPRYRTR